MTDDETLYGELETVAFTWADTIIEPDVDTPAGRTEYFKRVTRNDPCRRDGRCKYWDVCSGEFAGEPVQCEAFSLFVRNRKYRQDQVGPPFLELD